MEYPGSTERYSTGIGGLDEMLSGKGYFRGSSILISGSPGAGKTSMAAHFVNAICAAGGTALYFAFEESQEQIIRNMRSIGIELARWLKRGKLTFSASRSTLYGLETHLVLMQREIVRRNPSVVVVDPINTLGSVGNPRDIELMLMRLVDFLKLHGVTGMLTSLSSLHEIPERHIGLSSLIDTGCSFDRRRRAAKGSRNSSLSSRAGWPIHARFATIK